jgi:hypothetical protein
VTNSWTWWIFWVVVAIIVIVGLLAWWVTRKNRPFTTGDVFRASRWTRGNHLFPTQVAITPASVIQYTPQWIGREEESIHVAHVASVRIDTHLVFSDVIIETSGGSDPVRCHGHHKSDAIKMKDLIEQYQSAQYQRADNAPAAGPGKRCPYCAETIRPEARVCRYCGRDLPVA